MNYVLGLLAIVITLGAAVWLLTSDDNAADTNILTQTEIANNSDTNTEVLDDNTTLESNWVMLADNEAGSTVGIATVTIDEPAYVAIYQVDSEGEVALVGATDLLEAGIHQNLSVESDSVLASQDSVVAVIYSDTNNDGEFSMTEDTVVSSATSAFMSDIDVVGVLAAEEPMALLEQAKVILEQELSEQNS